MTEGRAECQQLEAAGREQSPKLPPRSNQTGKKVGSKSQEEGFKDLSTDAFTHLFNQTWLLPSARLTGLRDDREVSGGTQMCKGRCIDLLGQAEGRRFCRGNTRDIGCGRTGWQFILLEPTGY